GRAELRKSLAALDANTVDLETYMQTLGYLARVPGWGTQGLRFQFYQSVQKLAEIEPLALHFIPDQLRGSPLLFFSQLLDGLLQDANRLAGVRHKLFGREVGVGFRALNPGLARGVLHADPSLDEHAAFAANGIYLLPETISDLPPVAGIMTAGEGNPLSHIQLLARNLGIPNVGVDESLLGDIRRHDGEAVVLAVSPAGLVELSAASPRWEAVFGENSAEPDAVIRPDLDKLDLGVRKIISLDELRADDSGRTVGPKAAKLGELHHQYPDAVAPGVAIPFGVFREQVLDKPYGDSGKTVFEWMVGEYGRQQTLPENSPQRQAMAEAFRAELYDLIAGTRLDAGFQEQLRQALQAAFGPGEDYGVFIRSDTNVEDLPGFTGAGLNLTLPNVTGFDAIVEGIPQVWASPFTARAFAWRQSHMEHPEHVYPAVLLLRSVPNEKSGVMVTQDIDTGNRDVLSVAVNEGVGGAVDGQSAESLRIDTRDGSVRVLAMATAPWRRMPVPGGGVVKLPVSGSDSVLQPDEIRQLIALARELPQRFPAITDDAGNPAPADIEFGFLDGRLQLFQLRPFLESRQARGSNYLNQMDQALTGSLDTRVNMLEVPK
ncbi:MAG TPA: PEP/pyruvate-binding domain-containing protein, partial [Gammaproteobacteria bacterium]|nr:PEP/pyruvate-binding domain-containing protein [Gammaproteobacteria bacterium]